MSTVKRVQLAALLLVAAALPAGARAHGADTWTANLVCVVEDPLDPDYGASGVAKLTNVKVIAVNYSTGIFERTGRLSIACDGLTPGSEYGVYQLGTFTAGSNGSGSIAGKVDYFGVAVCRSDGTLVLVGTAWEK